MKTIDENLLMQITTEKDYRTGPPEDDKDEDNEEDDYGLNHDEQDDLSLNIEDDEEEY